jgi:hypothetical protein
VCLEALASHFFEIDPDWSGVPIMRMGPTAGI